MSKYRFFKVRRDIDSGEIISQLFELDSKECLSAWEAEHLGWYDSKKDLIDSEKDVKVFKPKKVGNKKETTSNIGKGKLELTEDQLKIIIRLLKGEQINTRRGLSLTSFSNLFGIDYNDRRNQKRLKPIYEVLLKQLNDNDEIKQARKAWYYKNAVVKGRKSTRKGNR